MSNTPKRASNSAGKSRLRETTLDLMTARQMLPLVKSIVANLVEFRSVVTTLTPERDRLDRHRRDLVWQERQRRYQVSEEIAAAEKNINQAITELSSLGVVLVDGDIGEIDFPTRINGRTAAFSWKLGEDTVTHWRYGGELQRRPIPGDWPQSRASMTRIRNQP